MELPHWLMAVGVFPLIVGFVGLAFRKNAQTTADRGNWDGDQSAPSDSTLGHHTNPPSSGVAS